MTPNADEPTQRLLAALQQIVQADAREWHVGFALADYLGAKELTDNYPARELLEQTLARLTLEPGADWQALIQQLFALGYGRGVASQVGFQHSHLGWVLETQTGIPISLALVMLAAADSVGIQARGINYPGHFLVAFGNEIVDPLALSAVPNKQLEKHSDLLVVADSRSFALRMLNNVKALLLNSGDLATALDIVDVQIEIVLDDDSRAGLLFERGEYWQQLGVFNLAADAYTACAEACSDSKLATQARQKAAAMANQRTTFH